MQEKENSKKLMDFLKIFKWIETFPVTIFQT